MRTQTINLRASEEQKTLIDRAADCLGKSRTEFILDTMCEASENVLLDQRIFWLDDEAFAAFQAILDAPPEPSEELRRTLNRTPLWER